MSNSAYIYMVSDIEIVFFSTVMQFPLLRMRSHVYLYIMVHEYIDVKKECGYIPKYFVMLFNVLDID